MDNKTSAEVGYITIIGWLIAMIFGQKPKNEFAVYHLKQGFGICLFWFLFTVVLNLLVFLKIVPLEWHYFYNLLYLLFLIPMIIGVINAMNNKQIPVPIFGKMFEKWFAFIK